ncbi:ABC transporter permease subunit, partial [Pseudomonas putida]
MTAHVFKPDMPPPVKTVGALAWMRANLFSNWLNTLLTLFALYLVWLIVPPLVQWAFIDANWVGTTRADCTQEGACWVFIQQRFGQFMYGYYPVELRWRVDLTVWLAVLGAAPLFIKRFPRKVAYGLGFLVSYPVLAYTLLHGGYLGLATVSTSQWGGLMLTLVIATVGIVGALPLGILLALGRRSNLPAVKVVCVTFIEFWRGVPLITVLFMSSVMLPLFLPEGMSFDKLLRAMIGVILFQSAYIAEVVRGGLQ